MLPLLLGLALAAPAGAGGRLGDPDSRPAAATTGGGEWTRGGTVAIGAPSVTGRLSVEAVAEILATHASAIRYCYERERVIDPTLGGTLTVGFGVGRDGAVADVTISESTLSRPTVEACLVGRFERLRFPRPRGRAAATVSVQLGFSGP